MLAMVLRCWDLMVSKLENPLVIRSGDPILEGEDNLIDFQAKNLRGFSFA